MSEKTNKILQNAINNLEQKYKSTPNLFFNEHDFHHWFFCMVCDELKNLIHPEYPSRKRLKRNKGEYKEYKKGIHSFSPEEIGNRGRGHYDFVVLNEKFYNDYRNDINRLSSKDVNTNIDIRYKYIDTIIEFKYITKNLKQEEIEYDIFKLIEADETENKIYLIFIRREIPNFEDKHAKLKALTSPQKTKDIKVQIICNE